MLFGDEHIRRYEETDGEVGHEWQEGVPTLLLTTKGRKTGQERKLALIYQEDGGNPVVVASAGGTLVEIQVTRERRSFSRDELDHLLDLVVQIDSHFIRN